MLGWLRRVFVCFVFLLCFWPSIAHLAHAQKTPSIHLTSIIAQVRGQECCSPGEIEVLSSWLEHALQQEMALTLAVRYDALREPEYLEKLRPAQEDHELAGYLEILPSLAAESQVEYRGSPETWYHANQAFLLGYTQEERQRLIDTYMEAFHEAFGTYPTTTVAWMIDAFSLRYLAEQYGVTVHELTREQWGVDSYSLHGGPTHYPYVPSENWAMIPSLPGQDSRMPLIVRQTVDDPVWSYGDPTSSYTTQPNDYDLAQRGFSYFTFLFSQAHSQPEPVTFTLLGLENSMPVKDQEEFLRQLSHVSQWRKENEANRVITARELPTFWPPSEAIQVYTGTDSPDNDSVQAWWIGTPFYRARVRYEASTLYLTDLRLYDPSWKDPYWETPAQSGAYWVVPFLLDGARFLVDGTIDPHNWNDGLLNRKVSALPTRIVLADGIAPEELRWEKTAQELVFFGAEGESIAHFGTRSFLLPEKRQEFLQHPLLTGVIERFAWKDSSGNTAWSLEMQSEPSNQRFTRFTPTSVIPDLELERNDRYYLLHPEIRTRPLDTSETRLEVKNRYAMIDRNPARFALWLKDSFGFPTRQAGEPTVQTKDAETQVSIFDQQLPEGYLFIDLTRQTSGSIEVTVEYQGFSQTETIFFVPNCKQKPFDCIRNPRNAWNFLQLKREEQRITREQQ